jgi:molybdenum cofactor biosynthesis enzyme MoaA
MQLENIGFYTLEDARAAAVTHETPLWRCELILTDVCNFKCPYCRGIEEEHCGSASWDEACFVVDAWASHGLKNVRFSGGEPTLWKAYEALPDGTRQRRSLIDLVARAKAGGIERIAVSTNGSVDTGFYLKLVEAGVNDFSISLDACCAETGDRMAGGIPGAWQKVVDNIKALSALTYVTVGAVFTSSNVSEFNEVVAFASSLGVADIRILSSAQWDEAFRDVTVDAAYLEKHPILRYRLGNFTGGRHVRGLTEEDNHRCPLMLDDMAILDGHHFPCIIYMREQGKPVGMLDATLPPKEAMDKARAERLAWVGRTDVFADPICRKNCLDVCIDYNNRVAVLNPDLFAGLPAPTGSAGRRVIPIQVAAAVVAE